MTVEAGQTLSHYRFVEKIGAGGMGVVWRATDTTLGRDVAIKVLPPDFALDAARRKMFTDEAKLASRLTDAHIAQVHELGHEDGTDFIVMEYVDGKPLDKHIEGQSLTPEKVAELGGQVARALSRAHRKGLIHRDLKPGNILVTEEGEAKVVDFGLATLFERADETMLTQAPTRSISEAPTEVGESKSLMGTIPYMSPEQVRLEKLDGRSDIFSLGSVLYEMATGQLPFVAPTAGELMQEVRKARPTPVRELTPSMPPELETIVSKAMAAKKEDRYQHAEDLAVDLKRLNRQLETGTLPSDVGVERAPVWMRPRAWAGAAVGLAVLMWLGMTAWEWFFPPPDPDTILVLPIEEQGAEGTDTMGRWFAGVVAANLAARGENLTVLSVPTTSERDPTAGRLLTGTLIREGGQVRASVQLIDASANRILWGTEKEAARQDITLVASEIARDVVTELGAVTPKIYEWWGEMTDNPALARSTLYLEVLLANRRWSTVLPAETLESLLEAFPDEPDAVHAAMEGFASRSLFAKDAEAKKRFEETLAHLMSLDPEAPWEDWIRAYQAGEEDHRRTVAGYSKILERDDLAPALRALLLGYRADVLTRRGLDREAGMRDMEEAIRLGPPSFDVFRGYAWALAAESRLEKAVVPARQAFAIDPEGPNVRLTLWQLLAGTERWEEALPLSEEFCARFRETPLGRMACASHAYNLQRLGRVEEARGVAESAGSLLEEPSGNSYLASYHAIAGDRDAAMRLLQRAVALNPEPDLGFSDPFMLAQDFLSLRGDPEFESLAEAEWQEAAEALGVGCESTPDRLRCAQLAAALQLTGRDANAAEIAAKTASLPEGVASDEGVRRDRKADVILAWYHALAGNRDEAISFLERRAARGGPIPGWRLGEHRGFDSLRGDPEFEAVAARLGTR